MATGTHASHNMEHTFAWEELMNGNDTSVSKALSPEASDGSLSPSLSALISEQDRSSPEVSTSGAGMKRHRREMSGGDGIKHRKLEGSDSDEEATTSAECSDKDGGKAEEHDPHIGHLSKEAEVFALQAIHTSLLKKLSEVGPILADVSKENRMYKRVLMEMGNSKEDIKRRLDMEYMRETQRNPCRSISESEATLIAAAALGKNINSPVEAMQDVLKLYRYCEPGAPQAPKTPEPLSPALPALPLPSTPPMDLCLLSY